MSGTFKFVCTDGEFVVKKTHFEDIGGLFPLFIDGTHVKLDYSKAQVKEMWYLVNDILLDSDGKVIPADMRSVDEILSYTLYGLFDILGLHYLTRPSLYVDIESYLNMCRWILHDHDCMPIKLVLAIREDLKTRMRDDIDHVFTFLYEDGVGADKAIKYYIATGICDTYDLVRELVTYYNEVDYKNSQTYLVDKLNVPEDAEDYEHFDVDDLVIGGVDQYYDEFFKL